MLCKLLTVNNIKIKLMKIEFLSVNSDKIIFFHSFCFCLTPGPSPIWRGVGDGAII